MQGETVFQALDTAGSEAQNRQTDTCRELTVVWPGRSLDVGNAEVRMDES